MLSDKVTIAATVDAPQEQDHTEGARRMAPRPLRDPALGKISKRLPTSTFGLIMGMVAVQVSVAPTLLPRTVIYQSLAVGISAAVLYTLSKFVGWSCWKLAGVVKLKITADQWFTTWIVRAGYALGVIWSVWTFVVSYRQQLVTAQLVEKPGFTPVQFVATIVLGSGLAILFGLLLRAIYRLWRWGTRVGSPLLTSPISGLLSAVLVVSLVVVLTNNVLLRGCMELVYQYASQANAEAPEGINIPKSPLKSGSRESYESWEDIGKQGKIFLGSGPSASDISRTTGHAAREPIRVYAGLKDGRSLEETADAVVAELDRTRAWQRDSLLVITTTGSGWVDEWTAQTVEYLTQGNVAIATMQYSFLPSAASLMTDRNTPPKAGEILLAAIEARLAQLPNNSKPKLYVSGESLGSYGGLGAFDDAADLLSRVDGALFAGTPSWTPLRKEITESRIPGSPEVAPVIDGGRHIRFATRPADLSADIYGRELGHWHYPRVVFLQHASDPVVWWNPDTIMWEPDWIREKAGLDVNPDIGWTWFITFWQVYADVPNSHLTPPGHGHFYTAEQIPAWAEVLGLTDDLKDGLSKSAIEEIETAIYRKIQQTKNQ